MTQKIAQKESKNLTNHKLVGHTWTLIWTLGQLVDTWVGKTKKNTYKIRTLEVSNFWTVYGQLYYITGICPVYRGHLFGHLIIKLKNNTKYGV